MSMATSQGTNKKSRIAILGTGVMGTAITQIYQKAGYKPVVWNRTLSKTKPLTDAGSDLATTVSEAITAGDLIISAVASYENLTEMLKNVQISGQGKILVNICSGTPEQARAFGTFIASKNITYLDAAAMSGVKRVGDPEGLFLYSGDYSNFMKAEPLLKILGKAKYLGSDYGLTPLYDTALFTMAWGGLMGFYHASALIASENIDVNDFAQIASGHTPFLNSLFKEHARAIGEGKYPNEDGNVEVHAAAMQYVVDVSRDKGLKADFPLLISGILNKSKEAGLGGNGIASVIEMIKNHG